MLGQAVHGRQEPMLFGGRGKAGVVIAWDRATHRRLLSRTPVGRPPQRQRAAPGALRVSVCPGLLRWRRDASRERRWAPSSSPWSTSACAAAPRASRISTASMSRREARGELVALDAATGHRAWVLHPVLRPNVGCATVANGVVFTATFDGALYGRSTREQRLRPLARRRRRRRRQLLPVAGGGDAARRPGGGRASGAGHAAPRRRRVRPPVSGRSACEASGVRGRGRG